MKGKDSFDSPIICIILDCIVASLVVIGYTLST